MVWPLIIAGGAALSRVPWVKKTMGLDPYAQGKGNVVEDPAEKQRSLAALEMAMARAQGDGPTQTEAMMREGTDRNVAGLMAARAGQRGFGGGAQGAQMQQGYLQAQQEGAQQVMQAGLADQQLKDQMLGQAMQAQANRDQLAAQYAGMDIQSYQESQGRRAGMIGAGFSAFGQGVGAGAGAMA